MIRYTIHFGGRSSFKNQQPLDPDEQFIEGYARADTEHNPHNNCSMNYVLHKIEFTTHDNETINPRHLNFYQFTYVIYDFVMPILPSQITYCVGLLVDMFVLTSLYMIVCHIAFSF